MVVSYSNAKIYKLVDNTNGNMYIGSTTQSTLAKRLTGHVSNYKAYKKGKKRFITSYKILENGEYSMVLLEKVDDCTCKDELKARERYHIKKMFV
jgi:predicted GIY-YIG superfamily endonuclease